MSKVSNAITMLKLLGNGKKYSVLELANILEVTPRMVRVYKEDLEKAGIYIDTIMGPYGGYVLKDTYNSILKSFPREYQDYINELYPDYFLVRGMTNNDVRRFQKFLLAICKFDKSIPGVRVNGIFDELTEKSIKKIQADYGFDINGIVGALLWRKIVELSKRKV